MTEDLGAVNSLHVHLVPGSQPGEGHVGGGCVPRWTGGNGGHPAVGVSHDGGLKAVILRGVVSLHLQWAARFRACARLWWRVLAHIYM